MDASRTMMSRFRTSAQRSLRRMVRKLQHAFNVLVIVSMLSQNLLAAGAVFPRVPDMGTLLAGIRQSIQASIAPKPFPVRFDNPAYRLQQQGSEDDTPTPTSETPTEIPPTSTSTALPTDSPTAIPPTASPTETAFTAVPTITLTQTEVTTAAPSSAPTSTVQAATATATATPTPVTPSASPTPSATASSTYTPTATVTATVTNTPTVTPTATATPLPTPDAAHSSLSVSGSVPADGTQTVTITATIQDANSLPVSGVAVLFVIGGDGVTIQYLNSTTDANGNLAANITSTIPGPKTITAYIVGASGSVSIPTVREAVFTGAAISGFVYDDKNGNGVMDSGEMGIPGIPLELLNNSVIVATTNSLADGSYLFDDLQAGSYQLIVTPTTEYGAVQNSADVNLNTFQSSPGNNFGLYEAAAVGGYAWEDLNQNGTYDSGEAKIPGVSIGGALQNGPSYSTTTASDGNYLLKLPALLPNGPANFTFNELGSILTQGLTSKGYNLNFEAAVPAINSSYYPANYNFESGSLGTWQSSVFTVVKNSPDGSYAAYKPTSAGGTLTSPAFTIPASAQSLTWWWDNNSSTWSGADFKLLDAGTGQVLANMYTNVGTDGNWQKYYFNITPYIGKAVQLFVSDTTNGQLLYLDDIHLEVNVPGWTITGNMTGTTAVQIATGASHDGSSALYHPTMLGTGSMTSPAFTIPASAQSLTWWWKSATSQNTFQLLDAGTGQVLATLCTNASTSGNWQKWSYNIAPLAGKTVLFSILQSPVYGNGYDLYLDDINLEVVAPGWTINGNINGTLGTQIVLGSHDGSYALYHPTGAGSGSITSSAFTIPASAQSLTWWWKSSVSQNTFQLLDAGTGQVLATMFSNASTGGNWQKSTYNIAPYLGKTVEFSLYQNAVFGQYYDLYLDDICLTPATPSSYTITETNPPGYVSTTLDSFSKTLQGGDQVTVNFGDNHIALGQSSATISPSTVVANGNDSADVTVVLKNSAGTPVTNEPVYLNVSGTYDTINGTSADNTWVLIGNTDSSGTVIASLKSTATGIKTVQVKASGMVLPDSPTVTFTEGPAVGLQALLPGESGVPGVSNGKTGTPASQTAGQSFHVTVRAVDANGNTAPDATGQVTLTSTDPQANIGGPLTLVNGVAVIPVMLKTAGTWSFTAAYPGLPSGDSANVNVIPNSAASFDVSISPSGTLDPFAPFAVMVTPRDAYNNAVPGYTGTLHFSSSDAYANLSADTAFSSITGSQTFTGFFFRQGGTQTLTVTDKSNAALTRQVAVTISNDLNVPGYTTYTLLPGEYTYGDITVQPNGTLLLQGDATAGTGVTLHCANLTVMASGWIDADGQGYPGGTKNGTGPGGGQGNNGGWVSAGGGGNGGAGGAGDGNSLLGGMTYGDLHYPNQLGSAGGTGSNAWGSFPGQPGGGAIHIIASSSITNDGHITANGADGVGGQYSTEKYGSGGGSGGSLWMEAPSLTGTGSLEAKGGNATDSGAGGGGRIAVDADTLSSSIQMNANGGTGDHNGFNGTIFTNDVDLSNSTISVSTNPVVADGAATTTVTVTLKDVNGVALQGKTVILSVSPSATVLAGGQGLSSDGTVTLPPTDADGQTSITLSATLAGTYTLTAQVGQVALSQATVQFTSGTVSAAHSSYAVTNNQIPADGASSALINITVKDAYGNPVSGAPVTATTDSLTAQVAQNIVTSANGTATIQVKDGTVETVHFSVTAGGVAVGTTGTLYFRGADLVVQQTAQAQSNDGLSGTKALAGYPITYTITVKNTGWMGAGNVVLTDTLPAGFTYNSSSLANTVSGNTITWSLGLIPATENVKITLTADIGEAVSGIQTNQAAVTTSTAQDDASQNSFGLNTLVEALHPVSPTLSTVSVDKSVVVADGQQAATITVALNNALGDPVVGHEVSLTTASTTATITLPQPPVTDAQGMLTATIADTALEKVEIKARDATEGVDITKTAYVTFVAGLVDPNASTVTADSASHTANVTDMAVITVVLKDQAGNPIHGEVLSLSATGTGNTIIGPAPVKTGIDGMATFNLGSTHAEAKTLTIRDTTQNMDLNTKPVVTFMAGPIQPQRSGVTAGATTVPADGQSSTSIVVTVLDDWKNPIPGAAVVLSAQSASGKAILGQPAAVTDANGRAYGSLKDSSVEAVTVSATAGGIAITGTATVNFNGADLTAALSGQSKVSPGGTILYTVTVKNAGALPAANASLAMTLPAGVTMQSHTAAMDPVTQGNKLTWSLGDMTPGATITFSVTAKVGADEAIGTVLTNQITASTASPELNQGNNNANAAATVTAAFHYSGSLTPGSAALGAGGSVKYTIHVSNTGMQADTFTLAQNGLDSGWAAFQPSSISLGPGQAGDVSMTVATSSAACPSAGSLPFSVSITSAGTGQSMALSAQLTVDANPQITIDSPKDGAQTGSTSTLFSWHTNPSAAGTLQVYPAGDPAQAQTFTAPDGIYQYLQVDGLLRNTDYEAELTATSACGVGAMTRRWHVGNGLVFNNHVQPVTIERDYDQRVEVGISNTDTVAHTLTASVENPYDDLIVNFVGSGSADQSVTVPANTQVKVVLALHAQDATQSNYQLTLHLTADSGGTPITDDAILQVTVNAAGDFTIAEDASAYDPKTMARTYVITNNGATITDLSLAAIDPQSGQPASMFLQPSLDHARLEHGKTIRVTAYPIFSKANAGPVALLDVLGRLASPPKREATPIDYTLKGTGGGQTHTLSGSAACGEGKQIFHVIAHSCQNKLTNANWYCTNRPNIVTSFGAPALFSSVNIGALTLKMSFAPNSNVLPHSLEISFNGTLVKTFTDTIPSGQYSIPVPRTAWNDGEAGITTQNVMINSQHMNPGHYVSNTGYELDVQADDVSAFMCAASQEEAQAAADASFDCHDGVFDASVMNSVQMKLLGGTSTDDPGSHDMPCPTCATQGNTTDPINTRTGVFSFGLPDIAFPTSAGDLVFQRAYSTASIGEYVEPLGYGWTYNHDASLIFPSDPSGLDGFVLFKDVNGNQYQFHIEADGTYSPGAGVMASLSQNATSPASYTLTTTKQSTYQFDQNGRITQRADAQGHAFAYQYDEQGELIRVSADSGAHFLALDYDSQGRIVKVSDYVGRLVQYGYNNAGDLTSSVDVLGQTWTFAYDANHRMTQINDPSGKQTVRTDYDDNGRAWRQYDGNGKLLAQIQYNPDGTSTVTDGNGHVTTDAYDSRGTLKTQTGAAGGVTQKTFDENYRPVAVTDPKGNASSLVWDSTGRNLTSVTDANNNTTTLGYDANNNINKLTDALGHATQYAYAGKLLTDMFDALNNHTHYEYDGNGWLIAMTDALGNTTHYAYNAIGQRISTTDPLGHTTRTGYDTLGRVHTTTNTEGQTSWTCYDAASRVIRTVSNATGDGSTSASDPCNAGAYQKSGQSGFDLVSSTVYDPAGNVIATIDNEMRISRTYYDSAPTQGGGTGNRPVATVRNCVGDTCLDPKGAVPAFDSAHPDQNIVTQTVYDAGGQVIATIDVAGIVTRTYYDSAGRAVTTVQNLQGQSINAATPPAWNASHPDWNIRSDSSYDIAGNLVETTDNAGHKTHYCYDKLNRTIKTVQNPSASDPCGDYTPSGNADKDLVSQTVYDASGNAIASIDSVNQITRTYYDAANRPYMTVQNLKGASIDSNDPPAYDPNYPDQNLRTETRYDAAGRAIASIDSMNRITRTYYDALGRAYATARNLRGQSIDTNTPPNYDSAHPDQNVVTGTLYDAAGRAIASIDSMNRTTRTYYDEAGRAYLTVSNLSHWDVQSDTAPTFDPSLPDENVRTLTEFDSQGRSFATVDTMGRVSRTYYDSLERPYMTVQNCTADGCLDPAGAPPMYDPAYPDRNVLSQTLYDATGRAFATVDTMGKVTRSYFDSIGRTTVTIQNCTGAGCTDGTSTTPPAYDPAYPDQNIHSETRYNASGNAYEVVDNAGITCTMAGGTNCRGVTHTDYDASGRVIAVTTNYIPGGAQDSSTNLISQTAYDKAGNAVARTDAMGVVTKFAYDARGLLLMVVENYCAGVCTQPSNVRTEYAYDDAGNRLAIQDALGHETHFTFDALGREVSETDAVGNKTTYAYDAAGQKISMTDANSNAQAKWPFTPAPSATYAYDGAGRLIQTSYPDDGTGGVIPAPTTTTYDGLGRRLSMHDGVGTTTWTYDDLGRILAVTDPFGKTVHYSYDPLKGAGGSGNRSQLTYPDGTQANYTYDGLGRMTSVSAASGNTRYAYDSSGRLISTDLPNGVHSAYAYDVAGNLLSITHTGPAGSDLQSGAGGTPTLLAKYVYAYDRAGNRISATETVLQPGLPSDTPTAMNADADPANTMALNTPAKLLGLGIGANLASFNDVTPATILGGGWSDPSLSMPHTDALVADLLSGKPSDKSLDLSNGKQSIQSILLNAKSSKSLLSQPLIPQFQPLATNTAVTVTVQNTDGLPENGLPVYAFNGTTYAGYSGKTNTTGQATLSLPAGSYRFRADKNSTQFWSSATNNCTTPGCNTASVTTTNPVTVTVNNTDNIAEAGLNVYAFTGTTYSGYSGKTDSNGNVSLTLPQGSYRFRADKNSTQFWSSADNACAIPGCTSVSVTTTNPVTVTVKNTDNQPEANLNVYAFNGTTYTGYSGKTDANGNVSLTLPQGSYRFRADKNSTQFWSSADNACTIPGCISASVTTTNPVTVSVKNSDGAAEVGLNVYVFNGTTYTGYGGKTDASGNVALTLPQGSYRFRADKNGTQYWSNGENNCAIPVCTTAAIYTTDPVTVTVKNTDGAAMIGLPVYAFNGSTYTGYSGKTDSSGQVSLTLPVGSYRFRADENSTQFWSDTANSCAIPGCSAASITVTKPMTVTVTNTDGNAEAGLSVYAFTGSAYAGYSGTTDTNGNVGFTLPQGNYRFRADKNTTGGSAGGTQFWSSTDNACAIPGCTSAAITVTVAMTVTVQTTDPTQSGGAGGSAVSGLPVYAFTGTTYSGYSATTNGLGQASFTLPQGSYRFRADEAGTQFWSSTDNQCTIPGCTAVSITVTNPVIVTVQNTDGVAEVGLSVYAFTGSTYAGYSGTTDSNGHVSMTLPQGSYRFRADKNETQFWSSADNACMIPGCSAASIITTNPVTVTVKNTSGQAEVGLNVYAFNSSTYTGYSGKTDNNGQVSLTLPQNSYRFRADKNNTQFWSSSDNQCSIPGCTTASIDTTIPVVVTVQTANNQAESGLSVYAFSGTMYSGYSGTTDSNGNVTLTLPQGSYRFRADKDGTQYWSAATNTCTIPGCLTDVVTLPAQDVTVTKTITYTYDPLNRLTAADYSSGEYFHYSYDNAGNRLTEDKKTTPTGAAQTTNYTYDYANRMTSAEGVAYTWDANGNMLSDGTSTYNYDHANRLVSVTNGSNTESFTYNGLGDRLTETVGGNTAQFTNDINIGLTQVLSDGTNTYQYGLGRISQTDTNGSSYFLGDALGSVRQLADGQGKETLAQWYEPYGDVLISVGNAKSAYGYTGEMQDSYIKLIFLRARYYNTASGQFTTHDTWSGDSMQPQTYNGWGYVEGNPINHMDPTGQRIDSFGERIPPGMYWNSNISRYEISIALPSSLNNILGSILCQPEISSGPPFESEDGAVAWLYKYPIATIGVAPINQLTAKAYTDKNGKYGPFTATQIQQHSCGEAAITMAHNANVSPEIDLDTVIKFAIEAKNYGYNHPLFTPIKVPYTSPNHMKYIAKWYSNTVESANDSGNVTNKLDGINKLYEYISKGYPVIVDVDEKMGTTEGLGHFELVTCIESDGNALYLNLIDPDGGKLEYGLDFGITNINFKMDNVWNSWRYNNDKSSTDQDDEKVSGQGWWLVIKN